MHFARCVLYFFDVSVTIMYQSKQNVKKNQKKNIFGFSRRRTFGQGVNSLPAHTDCIAARSLLRSQKGQIMTKSTCLQKRHSEEEHNGPSHGHLTRTKERLSNPGHTPSGHGRQHLGRLPAYQSDQLRLLGDAPVALEGLDASF